MAYLFKRSEVWRDWIVRYLIMHCHLFIQLQKSNEYLNMDKFHFARISPNNCSNTYWGYHSKVVSPLTLRWPTGWVAWSRWTEHPHCYHRAGSPGRTCQSSRPTYSPSKSGQELALLHHLSEINLSINIKRNFHFYFNVSVTFGNKDTSSKKYPYLWISRLETKAIYLIRYLIMDSLWIK